MGSAVRAPTSAVRHESDCRWARVRGPLEGSSAGSEGSPRGRADTLGRPSAHETWIGETPMPGASPADCRRAATRRLTCANRGQATPLNPPGRYVGRSRRTTYGRAVSAPGGGPIGWHSKAKSEDGDSSVSARRRAMRATQKFYFSAGGPGGRGRRKAPAAGRWDRRRVRRSCRCCSDQARSYRSRFITLSQADTKSRTNFSPASALAYTSETARSSELEPKSRSTRLPVQVTSPAGVRAS